MVRSPLTLCVFLIGVLCGVAGTVGHESYVYILLVLAVPWDKLGKSTGDLLEHFVAWRKEHHVEKELEVCEQGEETPAEFIIPPVRVSPTNGRGNYRKELPGQNNFPVSQPRPARYLNSRRVKN